MPDNADPRSTHNIFGADRAYRRAAKLDDERQRAAIANSGDQGVERNRNAPGWTSKPLNNRGA